MSALIFGSFLYYIFLSKYKFEKRLQFLLNFLPLIFIVAVRPFDWGADAETYIEMYNMVNSGQNTGTEISFSILSRFVFFLCNSVKLLFIIYAFISLNLKLKVIEKISCFPAFSVLLYFSCWFVLHDVYQIRVGVAIAISYFSLIYLWNKDYLKFLFFAFLATLFHTQASVLFLLILLPKNKISIYSVVILGFIIFASYATYFLKIDLLSEILEFLSRSSFPRASQIKYYYEIAQSGIIDLGKINAFSPIVLVRLFLTLILLFQYKKLNDFQFYPVLIRILTLSFAVRMFFYPVPVIGMRIYEFFTCLDIFMFPLFFKLIREKNAVFAILILYCLFMLFIVLR